MPRWIASNQRSSWLRLARPGELLDAGEVALRRRERARGGDERRVGDEPAGRRVDLACVVVARGPQLAGDGEVARLTQAVDAGEAPPRVLPHDGLAFEHRVELLLGDVGLAGGVEQRADLLAQLGQQLDVERGVDQPALRQRPRRPVGRRVLLGEMDAEQLLDDGAESHARQAREPCPELGVEDPLRIEADLAQAGEILARGMQDPLLAGHHGGQLAEVAADRRADRTGTRPTRGGRSG